MGSSIFRQAEGFDCFLDKVRMKFGNIQLAENWLPNWSSNWVGDCHAKKPGIEDAKKI